MKKQTKERIKTANDHLTLDEIGVQHDDMLKAVIAKSLDRPFTTLNEAAIYTTWCIDKTLKNLKINLHGGIRPEIIDSILKAKKVEIQQYKSNEHSGTFIYLDTELQYFISDIIIRRGNDVIITFDQPEYIVRTNVK